MKRLLLLLLICCLLFIPAPALVHAASGGVTAQSKGGNTSPTVDTITLVESGSENEVSAMTPLTAYRVKVTVGDINTLDDIQEIEFHIYYGSDGSNWDADQLAIFMWTKSSGWSMESGSAATSWELIPVGCIVPSDFSDTTGDWYLEFKPGKLARATATQDWFCAVTARDENKSGSKTWTIGASMSAYSEVVFDSAGIIFGDAVTGIEPGMTGYITDPSTHYLTTLVTSNATYAMGVKSDSSWTDGGSNSIDLSGEKGVPNHPGQFSLEIDNQQKGGGSPGQPKKPEAVTDNNKTIKGYKNVSRVTTGPEDSEGTNDHTMYMAMSLSLEGIQEVVYSGTITFTITN